MAIITIIMIHIHTLTHIVQAVVGIAINIQKAMVHMTIAVTHIHTRTIIMTVVMMKRQDILIVIVIKNRKSKNTKNS